MRVSTVERAPGRPGGPVSAPDDSALNHVRDEIVSLTPLGNRARVRLKLLTAEVTTASLERLELQPGDQVVASFKATQARLLTRA